MDKTTYEADTNFRMLMTVNKASGVKPVLQDLESSPLAESIYRRLSEQLTFTEKEQTNRPKTADISRTI